MKPPTNLLHALLLPLITSATITSPLAQSGPTLPDIGAVVVTEAERATKSVRCTKGLFKGWLMVFEGPGVAAVPDIKASTATTEIGGASVEVKTNLSLDYRSLTKRHSAVLMLSTETAHPMGETLSASVSFRNGSTEIHRQEVALKAKDRRTDYRGITWKKYAGDLSAMIEAAPKLAATDNVEIAVPDLLKSPLPYAANLSAVDSVKAEMAAVYDVAARTAAGKCGHEAYQPGFGGGGLFGRGF